MNDEQIQTILSALPDRRPCSRLEPYAQLIAELRRLGRTYREIERILSDKCDIHAPRSTINDFVRRRRRAKCKIQKTESQRGVNGGLSATKCAENKQPSDAVLKLPVDDVYQRIAALKHRRPTLAKTAELFHYDPNEPLHLPNKVDPKEPGE